MLYCESYTDTHFFQTQFQTRLEYAKQEAVLLEAEIRDGFILE